MSATTSPAVPWNGGRSPAAAFALLPRTSIGTRMVNAIDFGSRPARRAHSWICFTFAAYSSGPSIAGGRIPMGCQPSPIVAARRSAAPVCPPIQIGMPPRCTGLGSTWMSRTEQYLPSNVTGSVVHADRISRMYSSVTGPRSSNGGAPSASNSSRSQPTPAPRMTRPFESTSVVASILAARRGLRYGITRTLIPSRTRVGEMAQHRERLEIVLRESSRKLSAGGVRVHRLRRRHRHDDVVGDEQRVVAERVRLLGDLEDDVEAGQRPATRKRKPELHDVSSEKGDSWNRTADMVSLSGMQFFDVVVIGAGHAGCEAALAAARMGCRTLLLTMNLDAIGQMSCNPAVGGTAKGHLVREIDALGGEMGRVTDRAAIQFKTLNASRGPAVRASRAQCDRARYRAAMKQTGEREPNLEVRQGQAARFIVAGGRVVGVEDQLGVADQARAVVVTAGTFLRGLIHVGLNRQSAGRAGEFAAIDLSGALSDLGLTLGRLKTGTSPRLRRSTIDYAGLAEQWGDDEPWPFHWATKRLALRQVACHVTYTTPATHDVVRANLDRSPLYSGVIDATGVRYCPSIEDKVKRFADRERHQVILEPDGLDTEEVYANGISTSLPVDAQEALVRSIPGLERAEIMRPGYAIEYDFVHPTQLAPTLECRAAPGLYLAGQINGTTGYEEAAALGLWAGVNAASAVLGREPFLPDRSECYMAVLVDDLVTRGTLEPYRMFTSRAEYRLLR